MNYFSFLIILTFVLPSRLWIRRSLAKQDSLDGETLKCNHHHSPYSSSLHGHQSSHANHPNHQANHLHYTNHPTHHSNHQTNRSHPQSHPPSHQKKPRPVATSPIATPDSTLADPNNNADRSAAFTLKYRDFVPDNPEPGNHYKFEKLDHVIEKLNLAILNRELNAEDCITIETLYFPVDCDFIVDSRLELTLHSFPSSYVCILRVFYLERKDKRSSSPQSQKSFRGDASSLKRMGMGMGNGEELANETSKCSDEQNDESMTSKLRKLGYVFKIQIKDFIPRTLNRGTFFKVI